MFTCLFLNYLVPSPCLPLVEQADVIYVDCGDALCVCGCVLCTLCLHWCPHHIDSLINMPAILSAVKQDLSDMLDKTCKSDKWQTHTTKNCLMNDVSFIVLQYPVFPLQLFFFTCPHYHWLISGWGCYKAKYFYCSRGKSNERHGYSLRSMKPSSTYDIVISLNWFIYLNCYKK